MTETLERVPRVTRLRLLGPRIAPWLNRRSATVVLCCFWALFVLYPNPALAVRSIPNAYDPVIDPAAVQHWADELPDDPAFIEQQVEKVYVPYAVPWETHGVPWYFPTTAEVVNEGRGDCQARMLVFASILEAKGIPYTIRASFDHIWVEYENKVPNRIEQPQIAVMDNGSLQIPERWDWRESWRIEREYFWDEAPLGRKLLLFGGLFGILIRRQLVRGARGLHLRVRRPAPSASPVEGVGD